MFKYLKSLGKHPAKRENVPEIQAAKQFDDEGFENSERPEASPNIVFVGDKRNLLDNLLNESARPNFVGISYAVAIFITCLVVWSFFIELDEVSVAHGEVIPSAKVKLIQHLEGGILRRLAVREGDEVKAGDTLLQLSLGTVGASSEDMQIRIDAMQMSKLRLKAEIENQEPRFPADLELKRANMVMSERATYNARRAELQSKLAVILNQIQQRELEINELKARKTAIEANLKLSLERVAISTRLLRRGLTPRMEHLELIRERESLDGENKVLAQAVPRAESALEEAKSRLAEENEKFRTRAVEESNRVEVEIARLQKTISEAADRDRRTTITSPIAGIVKNLKFNTIGGVVKPGESILQIVPIEDELVIQARLRPQDRGYVREGQRTVVKITTYDFIRYGGLAGSVTRIAADTNSEPDTQEPYYEVIVKTNKNYLGSEQGKLQITPGMVATVDIHTGTRKVADFIINPVLKLKHEAFRER